ncbi:MAG: DUF4097 family beta strand repeat protein [Candidatus Eremiobacteraeota bacterium]|nr:DUF4097 family beta strand repeat protein [Candidatus Eremiobacteraeota bacterium]
MVSRSTLIGALVVVELALVGLMARALTGSGQASTFAGAGTPWWSSGHSHEVVPFSASLTTGPAPHVVIDAPRYRVTVVAQSGDDVRISGSTFVHGIVHGSPAPVSLERTTDGVRISAPDQAVNVVFGEVVRELHVTLPPQSTIEATGAGRLSVSGLRAKLLARLDNAALSVSDHRGEIEASSANGRIELRNVAGERIAVSTSNGRLSLDDVAGPLLDVHTANGRITAAGLRVTDGRITSGNGHIKVTFDDASDTTVTATSGNGPVSCSGASTSSDGGRTRVVTLGSGKGRFTISSGNGPVTITQGAHA